MVTQTLEQVVQKVKQAHESYRNFSQEEVDKIVLAAAIAANQNRLYLARIALEETKMGVFEDKVIKVHYAAEYIFNKYRDEKTCGIIERHNLWGIYKVADSMGIVAAITPCTNPTSTVVFKALLALKTRNAVIFAPHPNSKKSSIETARIMLEAAVKAGAPENIIGWIEEPTLELTQQLMRHKDTAVILATGGPGLVKAAYSSGKPAIGVGAGNTPAVIDETADLQMAATSILMSKTFDNGMICASEQSVIAVEKIYDAFKKELITKGAHFLSKEERQKLAKIIIVEGRLNAKIVGQSASKIAKMAGFIVPETTKILVAEVTKVGPEEPFSYEKLSPILALYRAKDFHAAVETAKKLAEFGGLGHTAVLYTNEANQERIEYFGEKIPVVRTLVNIPAAHGAIGDLYNFYLEPSLTLGCGSYGGNIISGNIGVKHLLNIKTIAERRENMLWFRIPSQVYFKYGCLPVALRTLEDFKRAFIVTDRMLVNLGYLEPVTNILKELGLAFEMFSDIKPDPDFSAIQAGLERIRQFKPDVIIAIGGGSPIDAAKIIWLLHDYPEMNFESLSMRFMDIRKRIYKISETTKRTTFVAIPTTSGTGTEVTPFAVITYNKIKYPIADYAITPHMAILEPALVMDMPKSLTAIGGFDAITHAIEALVSVMATDYSNALADEALRILFKYLPRAYHEGAKNPEARERVHYAATMAGMAFANAYLGICHSMAHKLGAAFNIPHGTANALVIKQVIRYNATPAPSKFSAFPQYRVPLSIVRYARVADMLGLKAKTPEEKVELLLKAMDELKKELNLPLSIKEVGVNEKEFLDKLDEMSELAFDDQCTGANPRYPLISEIKELYLQAYRGE